MSILEHTKAVIFDLDGTLVDSMWMWDNIDKEFLESRGIPHPANLCHEINGFSFTETAQYFIKRFELPETVEELKAIWNGMARENYEKRVPLKPGAIELMTALKKKGIPMGIATSNSPELAQVVYEKFHLERFIDCLLTSCQVAHGKPYPDVYLEVAKRMGVKPEDCLVFEDASMGIQAGKRAGMRVCGMYDEPSAALQDEIRSMADYYCRDFFEVM